MSAVTLVKLDELLKYKNANVIARYQRDYENATMPATQALSELLKYIWLCFKHRYEKNLDPNNDVLNFNCVMHAEMSDIDNMWHTFLLFTQDYHDFCNQYLNGMFFHHQPFNDDEPLSSPEEYEREIHVYLSYIYDNLGEESLKLWFGDIFNERSPGL